MTFQEIWRMREGSEVLASFLSDCPRTAIPYTLYKRDCVYSGRHIYLATVNGDIPFHIKERVIYEKDNPTSSLDSPWVFYDRWCGSDCTCTLEETPL